MAISVGTITSWEDTTAPSSQTFVNDGALLIAMLGGRNSAAGTPTVTVGTYNAVALTDRQPGQRTWTDARIGSLEAAAQGSNAYAPGGSRCTYSAWGCVGLIGARVTGAYQDGERP